MAPRKRSLPPARAADAAAPAATAAMRIFRPLLGELSMRGVDIAALLGECDLSPSLVLVPHARVPHASVATLLRRAAERVGDELLGLRAAMSVSFAALASVGFESEFVVMQLFALSPTLGEGLSRYARFYCLSQDTARFVVERGAEFAQVCYLPAADAAPRRMVEYSLGLLTKATYDLATTEIRLREIQLTHQPAAPQQEYARLFRCTVRFGMPRNALILDSEALDVPMRAAKPALLLGLEQRAATLIAGRAPTETLAEKVRALLRSANREKRIPTTAETARALGMSDRTLARRLSDAGTSHQDLVDELHAQLARRYLTEGHMQISEVAALLGYSQASAFQRAFKRWFGLGPKAFQATLLTPKR